MKLNLGCGNNLLNGYINIDQEPGDGRIASDYNDLNKLCDDLSVEEICANDCLKSVSPESIFNTLDHWSKKLKNGGIIKLKILDLLSLCSSYYNGQISTSDFNKIVNEGGRYKSFLDHLTLMNILDKVGIKLDSYFFDGIHFFVKGFKG